MEETQEHTTPVHDKGDLEAQPTGGEERSDRDVGGPRGGEETARRGEDKAPEETTSHEGGHGDKPSGFEPHT